MTVLSHFLDPLGWLICIFLTLPFGIPYSRFAVEAASYYHFKALPTLKRRDLVHA